MSLPGEAEEKIGKLYTRHTKLEGKVEKIHDTVFGNGLPGHEKRIGDLEEKWVTRRETCPASQDKQINKQSNQVVIMLWINGIMMLATLAGVFLK